jgi:nicotinate-nucleotide pyrophosphorylase
VGIERAHESGGCDRSRLGFTVKRIAHPIQERDEREVFIEVEFDRPEPVDKMAGVIADVVLVDNKFSVS